MPSLSTIKLIGGLVAALILVALIADRGRWMHRAHSDEAQLATICASVRAAADNPKLDCGDAARQIGELGNSLRSTTTALNHQNAAVAALQATSQQQQSDAAKAVLSAQGRARSAEATAERLAASSRAGGASGASCAPSKALQEAWQ